MRNFLRRHAGHGVEEMSSAEGQPHRRQQDGWTEPAGQPMTGVAQNSYPSQYQRVNQRAARPGTEKGRQRGPRVRHQHSASDKIEHRLHHQGAHQDKTKSSNVEAAGLALRQPVKPDGTGQHPEADIDDAEPQPVPSQPQELRCHRVAALIQPNSSWNGPDC